MEPVRLGIVGAGGIARAYADLLGSSTTSTPIGVADVCAESAEHVAARLGVTAFADAAELAAMDDLEAVVVCTPPVTHPEIAQLFFDRGVSVLCEKPLAVDRHAARRMAESAEAAGVTFTMATKFRFCGDVVQARQLATSGALGQIRLVENAFTSRVDMSDRWNSDPAVSGGGVMVDNGTHSVDLASYVAGPVVEVLAVETCRPAGWLVEDTARLFLRHADDVETTADLSWSIDKSMGDFLRIYGSEAEVRVGWHASAWRRYGEGWEAIGPGYSKGPAMAGALDAFCRALRGVAELPVTAEDAVGVATVIDAAYLSLARRTWVGLAELEG
jgi:predicted dehydrogenase